MTYKSKVIFGDGEIMRTIYFLFLAALIISCSSSDLTITKAKNDLTPQDTINYKSFWAVMKCAMPEKATNFTND